MRRVGSGSEMMREHLTGWRWRADLERSTPLALRAFSERANGKFDASQGSCIIY